MARRGRPSKNKEVAKTKPIEEKEQVKVETKQELNIDELVALKVAEILAQKELEKVEIKEISNEEVKSTESKPSRDRYRKRKFVPDSTLVRLEQSVDGKFIISDSRGSNYFIELNGYGDSTTMRFKDLKNYHGKHHSFLNKGKLKIIDVVSESGEIEFGDVIQDLNLQRLYENESKISPLDIEYYILDEESLTEFSDKLRNSTEILETIVEVANILYERGEFNNNSKMDVIRQVSGNYDLFKSKGMPSNVHKVGRNGI